MSVSLSPFAGAGWQFSNDSGVPLAGGKIYVYAAGTTTLATTYTTSAGNVANSNPIILDAAGRTPSEVWLALSTYYKFVLKTATDTLIGTYDNVPAPVTIDQLVSESNSAAASAAAAATSASNAAKYSAAASASSTSAALSSTNAATSAAKAQNASDTAQQFGAAKIYETWAALSAVTGAVGNTSVIMADPGTHTDPVVGGTVSNTGFFSWSASPAGWKRFADTQTTLVQVQVAIVNAAVASVTASSVKAKNGGSVADTAVDTLNVVTRVAGTYPQNLLSTFARWAKAFDAGSVNDDNTIVTGTIVSGLVVEAAVLNAVSASAVRGRVWQRPLSSANLNLKPGQTDDVVVSDTGNVTPPADWPNLSGASGHSVVILPCPDFEILSGYTYIPDIEWLDVSANLLATRVGYKTVSAVAQRYAGFYYASTSATDWTSNATTRLITLGLASKAFNSVDDIKDTADAGGAVPSSVNPSLLSPMVKLLIEQAGSWDRVKRMGTTTDHNGLARLFGDATWTPGVGRGALGVDFGPTMAYGSLTDGTTFTTWTPATKRLLLNSSSFDTTVNGQTYSSFKLADGFVDIASTYPENVTLQNFDLRNASTLNTGVNQSTSHTGQIFVSNGYIANFVAGSVNVQSGELSRLFCENSNDIILLFGTSTGLGANSINVEQCLFRKAGASTGAHGDVLQSTGAENVTISANVFYYPGNLTYYYENTPGDTDSSIRIWPGAIGATGAITKGFLVIGNLICGGGYNVTISFTGNNQSAQNMLFLDNRYAPISTYSNYAPGIRFEAGTGVTGFTFKNIVFFDQWITDSTPFNITFNIATGAGAVAYPSRTEASWKAIPGNTNPYKPYEERWGIFNFDRSALSARDIEALRAYGQATGREILMWNGDINPAYDLGSLT